MFVKDFNIFYGYNLDSRCLEAAVSVLAYPGGLSAFLRDCIFIKLSP